MRLGRLALLALLAPALAPHALGATCFSHELATMCHDARGPLGVPGAFWFTAGGEETARPPAVGSVRPPEAHVVAAAGARVDAPGGGDYGPRAALVVGAGDAWVVVPVHVILRDGSGDGVPDEATPAPPPDFFAPDLPPLPVPRVDLPLPDRIHVPRIVLP